LVQHLPRAALWVVVLLLLAGTLATIATAQASTPNYTLNGFATQPNGQGVPAGAQVQLTSRATGAIYTTSTTNSGGAFSFTTSSTGGALVPGSWSLYVPPQGNLSTPGCKLCAPFGVFPVDQNPQFAFFSATALTNLAPVDVANITVVSNSATLYGVVKANGQAVPGAQVQLLDPQYDDYVISSNNSTNANGNYSLRAPAGSAGAWVLKTTVTGPPALVNFTATPAITAYAKVSQDVTLSTWLFQGSVKQSSAGNPAVPSSGNVTLYDATNGYIYTNPTPPGGFYQIGTYPTGFTGATGQLFSVVASTVGYSTASYSKTSQGTPFSKNLYVSPLTSSERGIYQTTLNFSTFNVSAGTGSLGVWTNATLGNDSVVQNLPNGSIGQMWGQLGLDFAHTTAPTGSAVLADLVDWENAAGAFFPAVQAGTAINGTGFLASAQSGNVLTSSTTCAATCNLTSSAGISLGWYQSFALNGSVTKNSGTYTLSFGFAHPQSADTYNYTVVLPAGFALAANSPAPAQSRLVAGGPDSTWTKFTLVSLPSNSNAGTASFQIVKFANLTAIVNASVSNFAFSSHNVLNSTQDNYTVVVGVNQNVTFSALNSTYPAGTNGTSFAWTFGDGGMATTSTATTNHTYTTASGATPYAGKLTVTSSGGLVNSTSFFVWVGEGPVSAVISSNATAGQNRTSGSVPYVFVNWSTVLRFNATASTATISPTSPIPGVLSVAYYTITAKGYKATQNYSVSQGAFFASNYTYQFLGAGVYYNSHTTIGGAAVNFKGWQYNISLTVWDGTGQSASTSLIVLVNDTQKPVAAFQILNSAGKPVTGSGVVTASNLTAKVQFNGANASDPNNGSVAKYYWHVYNSGNNSVEVGINQTSVKPYPTLWLDPQLKPYTVNLTVTDLNGNTGYTTQSLAVTVNSTTAVIMAASNLTGPTSVNSGQSYTYWVNITAGGGSKSTALGVQVSFYLTSPSGTSRSYIAGTPGTVQFYNYTSGVVNSAPFATGVIPSMAYNTTYRAVMTWSPVKTGNYVIYANVTASNEYSGNYVNGPQVASSSITVNPNPTTQLLEYVAIAVAVVAVILAIIFLYRRRTQRTTTTTRTSGRSGIERARPKTTAPDDDEEDEEP
jgi:hypothetical protein